MVAIASYIAIRYCDHWKCSDYIENGIASYTVIIGNVYIRSD